MPMYSPTRRSRETGIAEQRALTSWFSRSQRLSLTRSTPIPVMPTRPALIEDEVPDIEYAPESSLAKGDGLSGASIVSGGSGYTVGDNLTPDGGEFTAPGRLRVIAVDESGAVTSVSPQTPGIYTVRPANPAAATGGSGTGATFNLSWNAGVSSAIYNGTTWQRTETAFKYTAYDPKDSVSGFRGNGIQNGTQCVIEFITDAPLLELRLVGGNYLGDLYVNGSRISGESIKTDTSGAPYIYSVRWKDSAIRHYKLVGINTGFGGINTELAYTIQAPAGNLRPLIWLMGDSYTVGIGAIQGSFNFARVMADALGCDIIADGISGAGWTSIQDGRVPPQRIELKLGNITRQPNYVFFALGYNDAAAGRLELMKTNFRASVKRVRELCPLAQIVCIGPATPLGRVGTITAIRETEMALCDELNIPFVDIDDWVNANNKGLYTTYDNVHPSNEGHMYLGVRIAEVVSKII